MKSQIPETLMFSKVLKSRHWYEKCPEKLHRLKEISATSQLSLFLI